MECETASKEISPKLHKLSEKKQEIMYRIKEPEVLAKLARIDRIRFNRVEKKRIRVRIHITML